MRAFLLFLGLILAALGVMALAAYPGWLAIAPLLEEPKFHRIASRIGMLALLVGFVLLARRMQLADRASLGFGLAWPAFLRHVLLGLGLGAVLMLPVVAMLFALDLRVPVDGQFDATLLARLTLQGLLSGTVVALIEETFLRGAMFTAIEREAGARAAIALTSIVYAALHFIGRYRIPADEVEWGSGIELLAGTLQAFAAPATIVDAFLCLVGVGVVLGAVRALTGNIAACIGLHAGWVWIITLVREATTPEPGAPLAFLVSRFDGFVGWLVLGWTLVIGTVIVYVFDRLRRSKTA